jgi:hypothetical protein
MTVFPSSLIFNSVYGEEFAGSQYFKAFTPVAFDLVPLGIFLNAPGAFGYPLTTWGTRVKFEPVESFYAMAGCYNGDPAIKEDDPHGVDFTLRGPAFVIGEIGYRRNYGEGATGLPGNVKLGAYYNGGSAEVFDSGLAGRPTETVRARYGFYLLGDQALALGRPGGEATPGRLRGARVRAGPARQHGTVLLRRRAGGLRLLAESSPRFCRTDGPAKTDKPGDTECRRVRCPTLTRRSETYWSRSGG